MDVDAINANPSLYMNYPDIIQIQEKQLKKKIEKEQREKTLNELPKEEALNYKFLYKEWNSYQDGFELTEGMRLMYKGNLWQVEKTHNKQSNRYPGADPTLFEELDGSEFNPITAYKGLYYKANLYYLDPTNNEVYKCRETEETLQSEGKQLTNLPHELVNVYFDWVRKEA